MVLTSLAGPRIRQSRLETIHGTQHLIRPRRGTGKSLGLAPEPLESAPVR